MTVALHACFATGSLLCKGATTLELVSVINDVVAEPVPGYACNVLVSQSLKHKK